MIDIVPFHKTPKLTMENNPYQTTVIRYIINLGYDPNVILKKTIDFFDESFLHHERLFLQNDSANLLGLDITTDKGWLLFVENIRLKLNPRREDVGEWEKGSSDIPIVHLKLFNSFLRLDHNLGVLEGSKDLLEPVRFSIARSITFLRLLPPTAGTRLENLPDSEDFPKTLTRCWKFLEKHSSFSITKRGACFSQRVADHVAVKFGDALKVKPEMIGDLRENLLNPKRNADLAIWFFPFMMFWYATSCTLSIAGTRKDNPRSAIWNDKLPWHDHLWSLSNEVGTR